MRRLDCDPVYETAAAQEGHFTTAQAAEAGYSPQLLAKYLKNSRIVPLRRGIYRLVHFPPGDREDLVVISPTSRCLLLRATSTVRR